MWRYSIGSARQENRLSSLQVTSVACLRKYHDVIIEQAIKYVQEGKVVWHGQGDANSVLNKFLAASRSLESTFPTEHKTMKQNYGKLTWHDQVKVDSYNDQRFISGLSAEFQTQYGKVQSLWQAFRGSYIGTLQNLVDAMCKLCVSQLFLSAD